SRFDIANLEFIKIMAAPFAFAVILITACCFFIKPEPIKPVETELSVPKKKTAVLLLLFALSIAIVFRGIPYIAGLIIPLALMFIDRKALKNVDYPLLFTFVFFFIFAGNMARIEPIKELLSSLLEKNTLLFSVISCQFISNVPSAVLLSNFTVDYPSLLVGVNIGGVGTLISSLASLITFREYTKNNPGKTAKYVALFSVLNFGFLIALTAFSLAIV
ncbi:MAG: citrate transporter, partial [Clostridia bacterium]|nr:citrate transporter [Clostridia bacterium]